MEEVEMELASLYPAFHCTVVLVGAQKVQKDRANTSTYIIFRLFYKLSSHGKQSPPHSAERGSEVGKAEISLSSEEN